MTTSFHKSNLGAFGENLPCDLNGYVHTTTEGWMCAPLDGMAWQDYDEDAKEERCEEMAAEAREAVALAEKALAEWAQASLARSPSPRCHSPRRSGSGRGLTDNQISH